MQRQRVRDFGTSLNFVSGNNQNVSFADAASLDLLDAMTITAWIKPRTFGESSAGRIVDKGSGTGGYGFGPDNAAIGRGLRFLLNGSGYVSNAGVIRLGTYQHVAVTFDRNLGANQIAFYVDGAPVGVATRAAATLNNSNTLRIGSNPNQDRDFDGKIDELKLFNRGLTADEILEEYLGRYNDANGLVLYTKFDEGSGASAIDSSGTQPAGTITGATFSHDVVMKARPLISTSRPAAGARPVV